MPNYFTVSGLAPTQDPLWRTAPVAVRAAFLRAARAIVLTEWDRQTSEGLDKDGQKLAPLKQSTIKHRRSAMGPADPHAPPLIPAHELSRTRSLVDGRVIGTSIRVFWKFDPVTGRRWGTILNYHRRGAGHLPVRDVFGLAPEGLERARRTLELWWAGYSRGLPTVMPIRPRPGKSARPAAAKQPAYAPQAPPARMAPSKAADVSIGADIYTMSKGSAAELLEAIRGGKFTGFRSYAGAGPPAPPPKPTPPRAPAPRPAPKPAPPPKPTPPAVRTVDELAAYGRSKGHEPARTTSAEMAARHGYSELQAAAVPAYYDPRERRIYVNETADLWTSPDPAAHRAVMGRQFVRPDLAGILDHELGHLLHHAALGRQFLSPELHDEGWMPRGTDREVRELRRMVDATSAYASTMPVEFVAEVYSGLVAGRTFAAWVMELYRSFGGPMP